ncbi:MAG: SDR family NAD(P)-dependent oxidoreductase [Flavobacteriales bacterium]|nr:SDR family NAD(P)-dependent oxidoreductase [Flavobacteriales bacterium]
MSKNAIVFGATSGIGRELAKLLVKDDYKVLITGRRKVFLEALKKSNPTSYIVRQHDITDLSDTETLFKEIPSIFDHVDLIIHNSGIMETNFDLEWSKDLPTLETNVLGATKIYQLSYNYFKNQGFGHLVSITSIASLVGNRHVPAYHASKAYQSNYMESLWMKAKRTKKAKINITNILPGFVDTDIIAGKTFWMAPLDKAVSQIYSAIRKKKRKVYITKRWRLIAIMMKIFPPQFLIKFL